MHSFCNPGPVCFVDQLTVVHISVITVVHFSSTVIKQCSRARQWSSRPCWSRRFLRSAGTGAPRRLTGRAAACDHAWFDGTRRTGSIPVPSAIFSTDRRHGYGTVFVLDGPLKHGRHVTHGRSTGRSFLLSGGCNLAQIVAKSRTYISFTASVSVFFDLTLKIPSSSQFAVISAISEL
jgi:hypothetical protein